VLAPQRPALEVALAVADQDLVDGVQRELERMLADELVAKTLDPEPAAAAQIQDQGLVLLEAPSAR
jgi:hypothetical protein